MLHLFALFSTAFAVGVALKNIIHSYFRIQSLLFSCKKKTNVKKLGSVTDLKVELAGPVPDSCF